MAPILWRTHVTTLVLMGWNLGMAAAATVGLNNVPALANARGFSQALWVAGLAQIDRATPVRVGLDDRAGIGGLDDGPFTKSCGLGKG